MARNRFFSLLLALLAVSAAVPLSGCLKCGCRTWTTLSEGRIERLKTKRETLRREREYKLGALYEEARLEAAVPDKSTRHEYLQVEIQRLDTEICDINCKIFPH